MTSKEIFENLFWGVSIIVLIILLIGIILLICWFLIVRPRENKKERKEELYKKKERSKLAEKMANRCYFCETSLALDYDEQKEGEENGRVPMCYSCTGKLERWDGIRI